MVRSVARLAELLNCAFEDRHHAVGSSPLAGRQDHLLELPAITAFGVQCGFDVGHALLEDADTERQHKSLIFELFNELS